MKDYTTLTDSTNAFYISQLSNFDKTIHNPLRGTTWQENIDLRPDTTLMYDFTSFTNAQFTIGGTQSAGGIPWSGSRQNAAATVSPTLEKTSHPLRPLNIQISYSIEELNRAQAMGLPLDKMKQDNAHWTYQFSVDRMVHIGDTSISDSATGFCNRAGINKTTASKAWSGATQKEILKMLLDFMGEYYDQTGALFYPSTILLPPTQFNMLFNPSSDVAVTSTMGFLMANNGSLTIGSNRLVIRPNKWLGTLSTKRAVAYSKDPQYLRYPLIPIKMVQPWAMDGFLYRLYQAHLGECEIIQPETIRYLDGI